MGFAEWHNTDEFKILIGDYMVKGWGRCYNEEYEKYQQREKKKNRGKG